MTLPSPKSMTLEQLEARLSERAIELTAKITRVAMHPAHREAFHYLQNERKNIQTRLTKIRARIASPKSKE